MVDLWGPAAFGAAQAASVRPSYAPTNGGGDPETWAQDCSSPAADDGTEWRSALLNILLAQLRGVPRKSGVAVSNLDDLLLARAIRSQGLNYIPTIGGTENALTATLDPAPADWAALTGTPFRFVVSTTNTGAATLNLNGLGARDIVYPGDNSPILAGELPAGAVRTGLYDGTNVQLIDAGSSQLFGAPVGQCQLRYVSATSIRLAPLGGDRVKVAGQLIKLPSAGVTAANTGVTINGTPGGNLASSTAYLVALNASGALEFWTLATGHGPDTTAGNVGVEVITGHTDKTLVGMVYTNSSSQFVVSASNIGVISWHNRRQLSVVGASTAGATTGSLLTYVELTTAARGTFITWGDETVDAQVVGQSAHGTAGSSSGSAVGIDVVAVGIGGTSASVSAGAAAYTGGTFRGLLSEGPHTITPMGAVGNAGTGTFTVQAFANIRG